MTSSGVFIVNFVRISHITLVFPLLTLSKQMPTGKLVQQLVINKFL